MTHWQEHPPATLADEAAMEKIALLENICRDKENQNELIAQAIKRLGIEE